MPYETNWYADGLGGEYPVEVWGLQYLPAGWITNRVDGTTYSFTLSYYASNAGIPFYTSESVTYSTERTDYIEDGTGINYESTYGADVYASGELIRIDDIISVGAGDNIEIPEGSGNYYSDGRGRTYYYYDGAGGYYEEVGPREEYRSAGTQVGGSAIVGTYVAIPNDGDPENYHDVENGKYYKYLWDGSGGYYLGTTLFGSFYSYGTVIEEHQVSQTIFVDELDGGNGAYEATGKYDSDIYKHNGTGGYFVVGGSGGSWYPNGTIFATIPNEPYTTGAPTLEIPSDSNDYFDSTYSATRLKWNGSGGYTVTSTDVFFDYGTFITSYDGASYYWDGYGGWYQPD
jgi:hypothetical protein